MIAKIIGAGLAGCEAAYQLAKRNVKVQLIECKPQQRSAAHTLDGYAELVCSNSLKSDDLATASGLLKEELRRLDSLLIKCAKHCRVPAGSALAVNREEFSNFVTRELRSMPNIEHIVTCETNIIPEDNEVVIVASGPLTHESLLPSLQAFCGDFLYFHDAVAPIVTADNIDYTSAFFGSRYGKGNADDYLNCPLNKEEFVQFWTELVNAQTIPLASFEQDVFEGCMPVEVMAKRGIDTIRYGMFKPVGLRSPQQKEPHYAVLQLRKENVEGSLYNLVGCQTNLRFGEQKRVFGLIPALRNAEFVRYGVMHRNTFINAPRLLNRHFQSKANERLFFAGQITGVEGYCESIASGLLAGINAAQIIYGKEPLLLDNKTLIGALSSYVATENINYQPMNANFGILKPLDSIIKDKSAKKQALSQRSLHIIDGLSIP